jgi:regulator of sigma E protease
VLDGRPIRHWEGFREALKRDSYALHRVTFQRGDERRVAEYRLERRKGKAEQGQADDAVLGIRNWLPGVIDAPVPNPQLLRYALREALSETAKVVELTVVSMLRLLQGRLSIKAIGGPLTIFEVAGTAAEAGPLNYLTLMAFISINLGLINLLPIPLLDGGHLPFLLYEAVARRPLSLKLREHAHVAGLVVLLSLMVLAFKNDIERQWPRIVDHVTGP